MIAPRLAVGARLRYDEVREEHLMLVPEGAVRLNPTAYAVLELCDGRRSPHEISDTLSPRYGGADVSGDVDDLLAEMSQRGFIIDVDN